MKVEIQNDNLVFGSRVLGPKTGLYVYPGEEKHLRWAEEVVVCKTPGNIDLLFVAGERVVGCEVKTFSDLFASWAKRRLHRQLRTLVATVDTAVLFIRLGSWSEEAPPNPEFWGDLLNLQTQGVYLCPVPYYDYSQALGAYRKALGTTGVRVLAGTDQRPAKERQPGWLLRRVPGIGPARSTRLIAQFGTTLAVLKAAKRGEVGAQFGPAIEAKLCQAADS